MRVGFICLPEWGAYYPTFAVTAALLRRGHDVLHFAPPPFAEAIVERGFRCIRSLDEARPAEGWEPSPLPEGRVVRFAQQLESEWKYARAPDRWAWMEAIAEGRFARLVRDAGIDLLLVDAEWQVLIPHLHGAGARVCVFSTGLMGGSLATPPTSSPNDSREGAAGTVSNAWAWFGQLVRWSAHSARRRLKDAVIDRVVLTGAPHVPAALSRRYRDKMQAVAHARAGAPSYWEFGPMRYPADVILCCGAFDFARARAGRAYWGPCLDLDRKPAPFPWDRLEGEKPLVYVSLGTHAARFFGKTLPFLKKVLALASAMPGVDFVVVTGKERTVHEFAEAPPNLIAVERAPQLALLERASVVVTHGGLGTVKEAIWYGVPLVVLPCSADQPGNAARVVHHGIGVRGDIERITVSELRRLVETCLGSEAMRRNARALSAQFRACPELERGLDAWAPAEPDRQHESVR